MDVIDLNEKIELIIAHLGLKTQKQLALRLHVDPAAIAQWKKHGIPSSRVRELADLIGVPLQDFISEPWQTVIPGQVDQWGLVLKSTFSGLIAVVRVEAEPDPPKQPMAADRLILLENEANPLPPERDYTFRVDERIYLSLEVPWSFQEFSRSRTLELLLFVTDSSGTQLLTKRSLRSTERAVQIPSGAPANRYKLASPTGRHDFAAIYLPKPISALNPSLANVLPSTGPLSSDMLNAVANTLLASQPRDWVGHTTRIIVSPP